jgi:hypothetical protein
MPLGARSKFMLLHYVGSQRAAKLAARGAELVEPAPQSPSIFCEFVQKGLSTTFATKLLRVPAMPNETELSITMGASSCCAQASRCCRNNSSGVLTFQNSVHPNHSASVKCQTKYEIIRASSEWTPEAMSAAPSSF